MEKSYFRHCINMESKSFRLIKGKLRILSSINIRNFFCRWKLTKHKNNVYIFFYEDKNLFYQRFNILLRKLIVIHIVDSLNQA